MESKKTAYLERTIIALWESMFDINGLDGKANFFMLGGSSLNAMKFSASLYEKTGIKAPITMIFEYPIAEELASALAEVDAEGTEMITIKKNMADLYEPFPLTDVQYAYWIGRKGGFELGNVSTHAYMEVKLNAKSDDEINIALNKIIKSQPMLSCKILPDATQKINKKTEEYLPEICTCENEQEFDLMNTTIRHDMESGNGYFDDSRFFAVKICRLGDEVLLHMLFDAIVFDGRSIFIFLEDFGYFLKKPDSKPFKYNISYRDYVFALSDIKKSKRYAEDKKFVLSELDKLIKLPNFNFAVSPDKIKRPVISHHGFELSPDKWLALKDNFKKFGTTANAVLMTLYSEMTALWSGSFEFTMNFTCFNRMSEMEEDINNIIGDFTQLLLIPVELRRDRNFVGRVKRIQERIALAMDHSSFSAIETERAVGKKYGKKGFSFPVVFTGMIDMDNEVSILGNIEYISTETSQVWMDMQAIELGGTLKIDFETVEELFSFDMAEEMLEAFRTALEKLTDERIWTEDNPLLTECKKYELREKYNSVTAPLSSKTLDTLFTEQVLIRPESPAVISGDRIYTYRELYNISYDLAEKLRSISGIYAAIMLPKGAEQSAAAMGVIMSGKAYVPIDVDNPIIRRSKILAAIGSGIVVTDREHAADAKQMGANEILFLDCEGKASVEPDEYVSKNVPSDTAYVIFTSGSTGEPKGVIIPHSGAVNTILDINKRFCVGCNDKTICLSNYNFDLSVYDIFGMLSCGGALVVLKAAESRDPGKWLELIDRYNVTIWNSVPAFMQMALEYMEYSDKYSLSPLKLVLLSGDAIPITLPDKIKSHSEGAKVICLGGATEASIWSNCYIAGEINKNWKMMPYGHPLTNQRYYVLNSILRDCPDGVKGRLYIGGAGLADGYLGDETKTAEKFIIHPVTGERLYDTGDNGLYCRDAVIQFIGRDDYQIKINGHRIELGEIEAAFNETDGVYGAVAVIIKPDGHRNAIAVLVKTDPGISAESLEKEAGKRLPEYMIPSYIESVETIPITANGKIDRSGAAQFFEKLLTERTAANIESAPENTELTEIQQHIADIWKECLDCNVTSADDDFFEGGGDSLLMIKVLNKINSEFRVCLTPDVFFSAPTISGLAERTEEALI